MKTDLRVIVIAAAAAFSGAGVAGDYVDQAVVVSVAPNMVASAPTCTAEPAPAPSQQSSGHSVLGMAAGAALGGLLGHQLGNGRGQTVTTIGGAVAGAVVGDKIANSRNQPQAPSPSNMPQRCTQNPPQQQGWLTTYNYAGRTFTEVTQWAAAPGQAFGVSVRVSAAASPLPGPAASSVAR